MKQTRRHTSPQRFVAEYQSGAVVEGRGYAGGWYVVAYCACHDGDIVSHRFETEAEAERAVAALVHPRQSKPER